MNKFKILISRNLMNVFGWRTNRKVIVIESDDWGMIRMASKEAQVELNKKGYQIHQCAYNSYDRLESDRDLEELGSVLLQHKDKNGNPPKFTINNVMANPDFQKISDASFAKYYFEPFTSTLQKYSDSKNVMKLYQEGISKNIFQPQLHGREHINVRLWLNRLQHGDAEAKDAFHHQMFTVHHSGRISGRRSNLDEFGNSNLRDASFDYVKTIKEAQMLFKRIWGFKSTSFIASCYVWHPCIEKILMQEGIKYIQGTHVQRIPIDNATFQIKKKYHYTGQKNKWGQYYLIRNCFFEPTESRSDLAVEKALREIEIAFAYKKPAIISSHRVNYIGSLKPENREKNLKLLKNLLHQIIKKWPTVEFMSSDQLGAIIANKN